MWWFRLRFFMGLECCILGEGAEGPNGGSSRSYWMSGRIISCSTAGGYYQMVVVPLASRDRHPQPIYLTSKALLLFNLHTPSSTDIDAQYIHKEKRCDSRI